MANKTDWGNTRTSDWKEYTKEGAKYRVQLTYGVNTNYNTVPALSAFEYTERYTTQHGWVGARMSQATDQALRRFPLLHDLFQWMGCTLEGPIDYEYNAMYWWLNYQGGDVKALNLFRQIVFFGKVNGDKVPAADSTDAQVKRWLAARKPALILNFHRVLAVHGLL